MNKRKGFSLLEVIIALAVITITFLGVSRLVSQNIRTNALNRNFVTAHYLNSEALEIVRNMRDSGWLQNFSFNAERTADLWGESLWPQNGSKIVRVDHRQGDGTPWVLSSTTPSFDGNELYLVEGADRQRSFTHDPNGELSSFARYVELEAVGTGYVISDEVLSYQKLNRHLDLPPLKATVVTLFKVGNGERELTYTTLLTDWKQGPL